MIDRTERPGEPSPLDRRRDALEEEFLRLARSHRGWHVRSRFAGRGGILALAAVVAMATGVAVAATSSGGDRAPAPGPLFAAIERATDVTGTSATLKGAITADSAALGGHGASYQFTYGTDSSYGNVAPESPAKIDGNSGSVPVSARLRGLKPDTVYHFRLEVITANDTFDGLPRRFRTRSR